MLLTKDQILKSNDTKRKTVYIDEWGGDVIVSSMSAAARDRFETWCMSNSGKVNTENMRAKLASVTVINEDGSLMFSESDLIELGKKSASALTKILQEAQAINQITEKDIDDLAKN